MKRERERENIIIYYIGSSSFCLYISFMILKYIFKFVVIGFLISN